MRQVTILKTAADLDTLEITDRVVTAFAVGPNGIEQIGTEDEPIPVGLVLHEPVSREPVTLDSDPLRWAELLPQAYRSGDYHVAVDVVGESVPVEPASSDETDEVAALMAQF